VLDLYKRELKQRGIFF